ncbi:MAG TPA: ankyrin repeat domain-containing protein [Myxococcota bacterium]|nr:ankyrin repeat domain-containing protein [Myxococcota bacterium]
MVVRNLLGAVVICLGLSVASYGGDFFGEDAEVIDGFVALDQPEAEVANTNSVIGIIAAVKDRRHLSRGELTQIENMLQSGASAEERDSKHGFTPLMFAAQRNDKPLVRLLLNYGADASAVNAKLHRNVAQFAADDLQLIIMLARAARSISILISYVNGHERRVLSDNERAIVQFLLSNGAQVDERDSQHGSTSLMFAAQRGDIPIIRLLLAFGADKSLMNKGMNAAAFARNWSAQKLVKP